MLVENYTQSPPSLRKLERKFLHYTPFLLRHAASQRWGFSCRRKRYFRLVHGAAFVCGGRSGCALHRLGVQLMLAKRQLRCNCIDCVHSVTAPGVAPQPLPRRPLHANDCTDTHTVHLVLLFILASAAPSAAWHTTMQPHATASHPQRHRTALMTVCDSPVHSQNHQRDGTLLVTVLSHRWPIHRHPLPLHPGQCAIYHPTTNWCSHSSNPSFVRPCLPVLPAVPLSRCPSVRLCTHRACHCPPEPPAGVAAIAVFVAVAAAAGSVSATAAVGSTQQQLRAGATAGATLPFRFPVPKMRENFAALVDEYYVRAPLAGVRHRLPACHTLKKNLHLTPPSVCRRNPSFSARPPRRLPITVRTTRRHVLFFVCLFSQHFCPARDSFFFFEISFRLFGVFGTSAPRTPSPTLTAVYDTLCLSIQGGPGNP